MSEHTPTDANAPGLSAHEEIHRLPNTFRLTSANRHYRMELERVLSVNKDYRAIRLTCTRVVPDRGTFEKVVALNLTLDEQIGYYSLLSKEKRPIRGQGLKIVRLGKSLILDLPSDPTRSGLVLIFGTEATSIPITLSIKNCIVMSGLLLRSIALNLGIDAATARYLINQWRPSPVEQGVTGED